MWCVLALGLLLPVAAAGQTNTPKANTPTLTPGIRQIALTWTHPAQITFENYGIRYRAKGTSTWTDADASATTGRQDYAGSATSATIPGHESFTMKHAVTYEVQLRAKKSDGGYSGWGAWSNTAEATIAGWSPGTATLSALGGDRQVTLTWSEPDNPTLTGYQYQKDSGTWTDMVGVLPPSISHTITGLTNDTEYGFRIRAKSTLGYSTPYPQVKVFTVLPAPTGPKLFSGTDWFLMRWTIPDDTSRIKSYEIDVGAGWGATGCTPNDAQLTECLRSGQRNVDTIVNLRLRSEGKSGRYSAPTNRVTATSTDSAHPPPRLRPA